MKTFFFLLFAASIFCTSDPLFGQESGFSIKTDYDTTSIKAGESTSFAIIFTVQQSYDASIFLSVEAPSLTSQNATITLSPSIVNKPYSSAVLKVTTKDGFVANGVYEIKITASNGGKSSVTRCFVEISNTSRWRFGPGSEFDVIPSYISQDINGTYWYFTRPSTAEKSNSSLATVGQYTPLDKWKPAGGERYHYTSAPVIDNLHKYVWTTNESYGVVRYSFNEPTSLITVYSTSSSPIPDGWATEIAVDTTGAVWIGTGKGLARLVGTEWTIYDSSNTNSVLNKEPITSVAVRGSVVWVGTTNGLVKYDGQNWFRYTPDNSAMVAPIVWKLATEDNGTLWMGLYPGTIKDFNEDGPKKPLAGLVKFDGTNWTVYNSQNTLLSPYVTIKSIAIDKRGNKWFATYGGANTGNLKFDNTEWTAFTRTNSPLPSDYISWLGLDNNDNIWFNGQRFWGVFNENGLPPFLAPPTGVEEQPEATDGITIYPNPSNTSFTISGADNILSFKLMNSLGIEVSRKSSVVSGTVEVDVADLVSGVYFVQLRTPTGMITKSIIVCR